MKGYTMIEMLIGILILTIVGSGILGAMIIVEKSFNNSLAVINNQSSARRIAEDIVRTVRSAESFLVSDAGDTLTLTQYDGSVDIYTYSTVDGNETTYEDNILQKNGSTIIEHIVKIQTDSGLTPVFNEDANIIDLVEINFGFKHSGIYNDDKEIYITTQGKIRN